MPASSVIREMRRYARLRGKPTRSTCRLLPQDRHRGEGYASNEISNSIKVPTARSGGADPPIRIPRHAEERRHRRLVAALNRKNDNPGRRSSDEIRSNPIRQSTRPSENPQPIPRGGTKLSIANFDAHNPFWSFPGIYIESSRSWKSISAEIVSRAVGKVVWLSDCYRIVYALSDFLGTVRNDNGPSTSRH